MAANADAYRTLGLAPDASLTEVKRAYRRLAKANHPDAAGADALPRFLAIQAAYDRIVDPDGTAATGGSASSGGAASARRPWEADGDRARATHRAYGGRARRTRSTRTGPTSTGARDAGSGASPGRAGPGAPDDAGESPRTGRPDQAPPRSERPPRPPKKATLGSTSYDGTEGEPFEPDWGGASWYGTTSGTYWTLNPKEYADPRKHGPEYQARARRAAAAAQAKGEVAGDPSTPAGAGPEHTTATWWEATDAGPGEGTAAAAAATEADPPDAAPSAGTPRPGGDDAPVVDPLLDATWLDAGAGSIGGRIGRAIAGWAPIALGIGWLVGELTGCGRFSATCDPGTPPLMVVAQLAVLAALLVVPRLAAVALVGAVGTLVVAVPAALVLASMGAVNDTGANRAALAVVLVTGWLGGIALGVVREIRRARRAGRPVS